MVVPEGWFRSARIGRSRRDSRTHGSPQSEAPSQPSTSTALNYSSHQRHPSSSHNSIPPTPSGYSSPTSSSPPNSLNYESSHRSMNQLVPIEVLVRTAGPRRDPADELLLRKFSSQNIQTISQKKNHRHWRVLTAAFQISVLLLFQAADTLSRRIIYIFKKSCSRTMISVSSFSKLDTDSDSLSWIIAQFSLRFTWTLLSDIFPDHRPSATLLTPQIVFLCRILLNRSSLSE